jgi:Aminotransferase class I and II
MDKYAELHYYVDDAHGMSIYGKHGRGYVLNNRRFHPRMVMGTSLNKAFASGGGVMLYPNAELARKVRTCGGPLITSGPMQPAALGAAVAAAKIHLSDEIYEMQEELQDNIRYAQMMLRKHGLPVISTSGAAVFFIGVSLPKMGYNMIRRMLNRGYYLNLGIFPAVPIKNTGIRFTITRLHSFSQIDSMIQAMSEEFALALAEEGLTLEQIYKAFKLPIPEELVVEKAVSSVITQQLHLDVQHFNSIQDINPVQWNNLFYNKGTFDWQGLSLLEKSFTGNPLPEENWQFDYFIINDRSTGQPVVATFLTTAMWKDDMLSPAEVSEQVERKRSYDTYYLTSTVISTGSLLSEGQHLYINRDNPLWKDAVQLLFEKIYTLQEKSKAANIVLRDFCGIDEELDSFLVDNGYFRIAMPDNNVVTLGDWDTKEGYIKNLSANARVNFKKYVGRHEDKFITTVRSGEATPEEIAYWYSLYLNVKNHSLALNTFTLPEKVFENLSMDPNWEILTISVKPEFDFHGLQNPVCVIFCHKTSETYTPVIIGLDYSYNESYYTYRQALYQIMRRAKQLKSGKVCLGFSASIEKRKVGAVAHTTYAYMQSKDSFNFEVLAAMSTSSSHHKM